MESTRRIWRELKDAGVRFMYKHKWGTVEVLCQAKSRKLLAVLGEFVPRTNHYVPMTTGNRVSYVSKDAGGSWSRDAFMGFERFREMTNYDAAGTREILEAVRRDLFQHLL